MSSPDAGQRFLELLTMMARLRGAGGCPWDREQTRDSLRPFLVEETYEVLDALDTGDAGRIREELGDLLFQVVFHTEIAQERAEFSMADLLEALVAKMTRRHPHVFGGRPVGSAAEALAQ
ncbi:MAG TPA: MazG nucleotide pyrophosphohydrolase domain-containing protein, partial [Methylomirabilota bacterium]